MTAYRFALSLLGLLMLQACATTGADRKLDDKLAGETGVKSKADLTAEASELIKTAPGLTSEQREQLKSLRSNTQERLSEISAETLKLRSVLIKDLVSTGYDESEVNLIKKRIRSLDSDRTTVLFGAIEKANEILGHETEASAAIMHDMWLDDHAHIK